MGGKLKEFAEEMGPDFEERGLRQGSTDPIDLLKGQEQEDGDKGSIGG